MKYQILTQKAAPIHRDGVYGKRYGFYPVCRKKTDCDREYAEEAMSYGFYGLSTKKKRCDYRYDSDRRRPRTWKASSRNEKAYGDRRIKPSRLFFEMECSEADAVRREAGL